MLLGASRKIKSPPSTRVDRMFIRRKISDNFGGMNEVPNVMIWVMIPRVEKWINRVPPFFVVRFLGDVACRINKPAGVRHQDRRAQNTLS